MADYEDKGFKKFERDLSKAQKRGIRERIEDAPPPGMLPDGKLNVVERDAPAWKPKVVDDDGNEIDPDA